MGSLSLLQCQLFKALLIVNVASLVAQTVKSLPAMWETGVRSLVWKDSPEKGMATHFSILAWKIPRTEETGGLHSRGSKKADLT